MLHRLLVDDWWVLFMSPAGRRRIFETSPGAIAIHNPVYSKEKQSQGAGGGGDRKKANKPKTSNQNIKSTQQQANNQTNKQTKNELTNIKHKERNRWLSERRLYRNDKIALQKCSKTNTCTVGEKLCSLPLHYLAACL